MRKPRIATRLLRLLKMLLPIVLVVALAVVGVSVWMAYSMSQPPRHPYLVTPQNFSHVSDRGVKVTDEKWINKDGTQSSGWLLRGSEGLPAVIILHRYGADRSWLLNLGVKLNEATNLTVIWPDARGHGESPTVKWTSFGTREADDVTSVIEFLGTLKTAKGTPLVADRIGIYGNEMGAYAGLLAAAQDTGVQALALDSIPASPDELLRTVVRERTGFDKGLPYQFARLGARLYLMGHYKNQAVCEVASTLSNRRILLLAGGAQPDLRESTIALSKCVPNSSTIEMHDNLPVIGFDLHSTTGQQSEAYDRRVIEFFDKSLGAHANRRVP